MSRILVVEDDATTSMMLEFFFQDLGFETAAANSLASARAILNTEKIDLIMTDLSLPDGSGLQLGEFSTIPSIVASGHASPEDKERSRQAGFRHHLTKPVDLDLLHSVVQEIFR